MTLPLLLLLLCTFAFKPVRPKGLLYAADKPITVVIDAGHGGIDAGARVNDGVAEKDITLDLAKKVNELAPQYNVRVILTRSTDILPGNSTDIRAGLIKRVEITEKEKADLFISLHVNADNPGAIPEPGIEAFVSGRRKDEQGKLLASALLQQLGTLYNTIPQIFQQQERGIWVLDHNVCPAVLLECGNLSIPADVSFITGKDNQEKLARQILQGIVNFSKTP